MSLHIVLLMTTKVDKKKIFSKLMKDLSDKILKKVMENLGAWK